MESFFSHPILSSAEAKAWESRLLADEPAEWAAMQHAGKAIALAVVEDTREIGGLAEEARLLVLVGKGHNGGDALLAATEILRRFPRAQAEILLCFGESPLRPLARRALDELRALAGTRAKAKDFGALKGEPARYNLCLDGIFGFQFRPPMDAATTEILTWVNTHPHIKIRAAVDLPSGVAETNASTVFRADFTYATGIVKSPVLAADNADFVGRIRYLDLGFFGTAHPEGDGLSLPLGTPYPPTPNRVLLPSVLAPLAQLRPAHTDKRTYGHLFVVGGSKNYPGAVLMAVRAALRSGTGLLTAFVPESLVPAYAAQLPETMWVGLSESPSGGMTPAGLARILEKMSRATALVIGPGLGAEPETLELVRGLVTASPLPMVLDADALRPEIVTAAVGRRFICTPHAGEYQRIAGAIKPSENSVVVRKGSPTRIEDGKNVYFSLAGGPVLARGGSGDLLAGLVGGLLVQAPGDLLLAAARGVVWHGLAADLLARDKGQVAVQTTQLLDYLQPALRLADNDTT
jgi:ADP-dependent NAD(P)H-hydrate dehydratase / NAD(P)H-hydrate epimerase